MARPKLEWDPSWDDDWQAAQAKLEEEIETEHPRPPKEAVSFYRYGFGASLRHPTHEWSDIEADMYQDYMGGAPEPGESEEDVDWEEAGTWARRGWLAARCPVE